MQFGHIFGRNPINLINLGPWWQHHIGKIIFKDMFVGIQRLRRKQYIGAINERSREQILHLTLQTNNIRIKLNVLLWNVF